MDSATKDMLVFSGTANPELSADIAAVLGVELGDVRIEKFSNGEIYVRYNQSVRGSDVFIIQSVAGASVNDALMELLIMIDAAKRASAHTITAVLPHYGYARQDKKSAAREPITARLVANLLETAGIERLITIDLHQGQIQGFFDCPVNHLTALSIFGDYFGNKKFDKPLCVVSPDVGRAKASKKLADILGAELAIMHKSRPAHNVAEVSSVIGDVKGKVCIINDDMIDTAGTIGNAAKALREAGAEEIHICATHGVFSGPAYERLAAADVEEIVVTNSVRIPPEKQYTVGDKLVILSVAPLFAKAISNVYNNQSVSELFDPNFEI